MDKVEYEAKEGDIVRCLKSSGGRNAYIEGDTYVVEQVYDGGNRIMTRHVETNACNGWVVENFELKQKKAPERPLQLDE